MIVIIAIGVFCMLLYMHYSFYHPVKIGIISSIAQRRKIMLRTQKNPPQIPQLVINQDRIEVSIACEMSFTICCS